MKLNFKQPKYVLPLIALPFFCLFFYALHSPSKLKEKESPRSDGLNSSVGSVAEDVRKRNLSSKLDAFRNTYKDANGQSAVGIIPAETSNNPVYRGNDFAERARLDSINRSIRAKLSGQLNNRSVSNDDKLIAAALANVGRQQSHGSLDNKANATVDPAKDPMEIFRKQMAYMDSISKENDPAFKADKEKKQRAEELQKVQAAQVKYAVSKATPADEGFNTIRPGKDQEFIKAIIDENETGYAGSRIRLRLLEDIRAGGFLIPKGTYLYAQVSGFSQQRVALSIVSIMAGGKIFPVKLSVYDLDGLPGLYVPESAFRDFTKDLSGNTIQGVSIDGGSGSQFLMSSVARIFQSTSSAITEIIRKNKAKMKYGTYLYLIDSESLQAEQKTY